MKPLVPVILLVVAGGSFAWWRTRSPDGGPGTALPGVPPAGATGQGDLGPPVRSFALPEALREVSAVTGVDADTVACLQDEKGVLFLVDVRSGRVRAQRPFGPDGDYEGLTRVGQDFFVLRSDGVLLRVSAAGERLAIADTFHLATPNHDLEGLGHDPRQNVLLLAPKDVRKPAPADPPDDAGEGRRPRDRAAVAERKELRDQRVLYAWDLQTRQLRAEPALRFSVAALRDAAAARGDDLPTRTTRRGTERTVLRLMFSCVAVHPTSGEIYLLSAVDRVLAVVDRRGELRRLHRLDSELLPKPEGITFLPGGEMVLTSEGVDGPGRLAVYRAGG